MIIVISAILFFLLFLVSNYKNKKRVSIIAYVIFAIILLATNGQFYNDYPQYLDLYLGEPSMYGSLDINNGYDLEKPFAYWVLLIRHILPISSYTYILCYSLMWMLPFFFILKKGSNNVPLSLFLICTIGGRSQLLFIFTAQRQMIANVSIIWVYYVLNFSNLRRNRKYAIVCLLIVLALFAHSTSYFVIPLLTILYFIKNKLSKNILIVMMIISLIIGPYVQNFLRPIFVGLLLSLGSSDAIARSTRYFAENIYDIQVANYNALLPFTAVGITILSFYTKEELNKFGAKCIAFAVIAYNLFNSVSLLNRSLMLFIIFGCILGLPEKIQKPSKQVKLAFSFVALMLFYTTFNAYSHPYNPNSDEGNRLFPYPYVWENKVL